MYNNVVKHTNQDRPRALADVSACLKYRSEILTEFNLVLTDCCRGCSSCLGACGCTCLCGTRTSAVTSARHYFALIIDFRNCSKVPHDAKDSVECYKRNTTQSEL